MRILMLTWDYPPAATAGPGRHAAVLARHLVALGNEVHVVTRSHGEAPRAIEERVDGVHVVRVAEAPPVIPLTDRIPAALSFNSRVQAAAAKLVRRFDVDVVHVHDRLVTYAASGLKEAFGLPIVASFHAMEHRTHPGLPDEASKLVHQVEWWLSYEARRVVTCTELVRDQLRDHFRLPADELEVVPAAVEVPSAPPDADLRGSLAGPRTRLVLVGGRLDDAGLDTVLSVLPQLRAAVGPTRLAVAASGVEPAEVRRRARRAGARHHVRALGPVDGERFARHAAVADAVVVLDDVEPCSDLVVDAIVAGTPVVASRSVTAGDERVRRAVRTVRRRAPDAVRGALESALQGAAADEELAANQRQVAERHEGGAVAAAMLEVYEQAIADERRSAHVEQRPPLRPILQAAPLLELETTNR